MKSFRASGFHGLKYGGTGGIGVLDIAVGDSDSSRTLISVDRHRKWAEVKELLRNSYNEDPTRTTIQDNSSQRSINIERR